MDTYDELSEDELNDYNIQLSIQNSCSEAFLQSSARYKSLFARHILSEVWVLRQMLRHTFAFREMDGRGWLPLHRAAAQPLLEVLETVLTREFRTAVGGETPLTLAVKVGRVKNAKSLIKHGASPHNTNGKSETPLLLAVRSGSYEMTHMLVNQGAWVEQACRKRWTAMHEAAKVGDSDILMQLLRNGGRVNQKDISGVTPLAVAAAHGHIHIIEILVNCGSNVNSQACNGDSVLLDAAGLGNTACIKFLLDNGANPNLHSATGQLPIHKAAYAGHYDALKILIPLTHKKAIKEAGQSPVHSAAEGGHSRCLKLLLACGYDVNYCMNTRNSEAYRDMRRTALYYAVSNGDVECTRVLLAAGAKTDLDPLCCLLVAVRSGRYEIVKLLLAAKADVNCYFNVVSDTVFPTALQYCLKDEMMMRLLLNNGYKVERCFQCQHGLEPSEAYEGEDKIPVIMQKTKDFCEFMSLCCVVYLSGRVVLTLLDYIKHVQICYKLRIILEKQKEWPDICHTLRSPRPLRHLCRLEIRQRLTLKRLNNPEIMNLFPPDSRALSSIRSWTSTAGTTNAACERLWFADVVHI
uniref:Ankyrin repeat and SOCS box containing 15 n=1 Tax=Neogobius melanostomus TaxID=47308 RepID=A0A8C6SP20_9GOBI